MNTKQKAMLSLLLLIPAPSIGAFCGMVLFPNSVLGTSLFAFSKVWLFVLPVALVLVFCPGLLSQASFLPHIF